MDDLLLSPKQIESRKNHLNWLTPDQKRFCNKILGLGKLQSRFYEEILCSKMQQKHWTSSEISCSNNDRNNCWSRQVDTVHNRIIPIPKISACQDISPREHSQSPTYCGSRMRNGNRDKSVRSVLRYDHSARLRICTYDNAPVNYSYLWLLLPLIINTISLSSSVVRTSSVARNGIGE